MRSTTERAASRGARRREERSTKSRTGNPEHLIALQPLHEAVLVSALLLLIALTTLDNGFVDLDDSLYLANRTVAAGISWAGLQFAFTSVTDLYWHPIAWLSHEVDVSLFGFNPAGHHFTSALLHSIAAGLLFLLLRRLGANAWSSASGALLWAIHPLRVESFAWIAERKDVLCALFFIATLLAYLNHADRPSRWSYLAWSGLGALAMMSKPTAVCLVPILFLLDYWPLGRRLFDVKRLVEKLPLLLLTAVLAWLTFHGQKESGSMSHLEGVPLGIRLENIPVFYMRYIGKMLWPVNLACFYPYDFHPGTAKALASAFGLSILTAGVVWQRHRRPYLLLAWIWFLVALVPNIGLLQAGRQSIADRFTNLAMIGIAVGAALFLTQLVSGAASKHLKKVVAVSISAALAILALLTLRQIGYWHDTFRLFDHAIAVEDSDYIRASLANTLIGQKRYTEAEPHLVIATRRSPVSWEYHNTLANVLLQMGRLDEATVQAAAAVRLAPENVAAAETMGSVLFRRQDYQGTLEQFNHAIELGAEKAAVAAQLNDMGASAASRGKPGEAEPLIRRALDLNPRLPQGWRNLILIQIDRGRPQEARVTLQEAVRATGAQAAYDHLFSGSGPLR